MCHCAQAVPSVTVGATHASPASRTGILACPPYGASCAPLTVGADVPVRPGLNASGISAAISARPSADFHTVTSRRRTDLYHADPLWRKSGRRLHQGKRKVEGKSVLPDSGGSRLTSRLGANRQVSYTDFPRPRRHPLDFASAQAFAYTNALSRDIEDNPPQRRKLPGPPFEVVPFGGAMKVFGAPAGRDRYRGVPRDVRCVGVGRGRHVEGLEALGPKRPRGGRHKRMIHGRAAPGPPMRD